MRMTDGTGYMWTKLQSQAGRTSDAQQHARFASVRISPTLKSAMLSLDDAVRALPSTKTLIPLLSYTDQESVFL